MSSRDPNTARRNRRAVSVLAGALIVGSSALTPGCYTSQLGLIRSGLDSLRVQVDTLNVRDSVAFRVLADTRQELSQQRELILSTRATSGSTLSELVDQMSRLEGKLDEVMHRFTSVAERVSAPPAVSVPPPATGTTPGTTPGASPATPVTPPPSNVDPNQIYDFATRDLTEGRYALSLQGYRDFLRRFPASELADNAQYGVGECFFAQAAFDSAAVEYARVGEVWPKGDRAAAALYKLALSQDRLGRNAESKRSLEELVRRFPGSGEAGLARDRLGAARR